MVVRHWGLRRLAVIPESQHDTEHNKAAHRRQYERPFVEPKQARAYQSSETNVRITTSILEATSFEKSPRNDTIELNSEVCLSSGDIEYTP